MFHKNSVLSTLLVSCAVSAAVVGIYHKAYVSRRCVNQNNLSKLSSSIEPIVWNVIKQNPEAFFKVMNEAAQVQHERVKEDLEKSATQAKDQLLNMGVRLGLSDQASVQFVAFVDFMDPVSHEFLKVAFRVMRDKRDVSFRLIPVIINGLNSEVMARFILSANMQKSGNMMQFLENFSDRIAHMTRAKLLDTAKQAGFDIPSIERGEGDKKVEEELASYMKTAESLKVQIMPTVYVLRRSGKMELVPPMDLNGFMELVQTVSTEKPETSTKADATSAGSSSTTTPGAQSPKDPKPKVENKTPEAKPVDVKPSDPKADVKKPESTTPQQPMAQSLTTGPKQIDDSTKALPAQAAPQQQAKTPSQA